MRDKFWLERRQVYWLLVFAVCGWSSSSNACTIAGNRFSQGSGGNDGRRRSAGLFVIITVLCVAGEYSFKDVHRGSLVRQSVSTLVIIFAQSNVRNVLWA